MNTAALAQDEADALLARLSDEHDLPACDPVRGGTGVVVEEVRRRFG